jgi:ADP-ribose pyrophosphatase YjhB (NUDIX family)
MSDHSGERTGGSRWRPVEAVRAVAIGIARRDDRLLAVEVLDNDGALKGWRPPGGGVNFMELAADTLKREIREELGCDVRIEGAPEVFENLYMHHEAKGHEIVFAYEISLLDGTIHSRDRFVIKENEGSAHFAEWVEIDRFLTGRDTLYPAGLAGRLLRAP